MKVVSCQLSVVSKRSSRARRLPVFALVLLCVKNSAQGLPLAAPQSVGMNAARLGQIEQLVHADIADKKLPGAVIVVGHKGKIVYRKAFGNRSLVPTVEKMTVDTIFDVASLTKPVATATSIMILMEQGKIRLSDTINKYIPDIDDEQATRVTIQQLLTHTSGYAPDFDLKEKWAGREGMLAALKKEKLRTPPGTKFVYSDIGFIVLGEILERIVGLKEDDIVRSNLTRGEGTYRSGFRRTSYLSSPQAAAMFNTQPLELIAPTENVRGQNSYLGLQFE